MDEIEYKAALVEVNPMQCVYEKALFTTSCHCPLAKRFNIADRQGIRCQSKDAQQRCQFYLELLRAQSRFLFHQTHAPSILPHAKEIKVQLGGLFAVRDIVDDSGVSPDKVEDVQFVLKKAWLNYDEFKRLDFPVIIQRIAHYEVRKSNKKS